MDTDKERKEPDTDVNKKVSPDNETSSRKPTEGSPRSQVNFGRLPLGEDSPATVEKSKADKDKRKKNKADKASKAAGDDKNTNKGSAAKEPRQEKEHFIWSFDSKKLRDGAYIMKLTLDDRLSDPEHHLQTVAFRSLVVDNQAPEIGPFEAKRNPEGNLAFTVAVQDKLTPIVNALYRLDDGEPFALASAAGTSTALKGEFGVSSLKIKGRSHKIEVKFTDAAGNTATRTFTAK